MTNILALDLGTKTGWSLSTSNDRIVSGTENFKASRFQSSDRRFFNFKKWLTEIKNKYDGVDVVYYEEVRKHIGVDAAHIYGGFKATLTVWCEHHQIPYVGVPVGTIKKHATGKGNSNKQAMIDSARSKGHFPEDDNEADAIAILYFAKEAED